MPLTSSVMGQMMARFRNFYITSQDLVEKRLNAFRTGAKIYLSEKILGGYVHFKANRKLFLVLSVLQKLRQKEQIFVVCTNPFNIFSS